MATAALSERGPCAPRKSRLSLRRALVVAIGLLSSATVGRSFLVAAAAGAGPRLLHGITTSNTRNLEKNVKIRFLVSHINELLLDF